MNPNITLGEVKAHCAEMFEKYKDECCDHCKFADLGCCDAPSDWKIDNDTFNDGEVMCDDGPMTVRKLIAYLSVCNPDYPVCFEGEPVVHIHEYRYITEPEHSYVNMT